MTETDKTRLLNILFRYKAKLSELFSKFQQFIQELPDSYDKIRLTTVHQVKGLEFDNVYITDKVINGFATNDVAEKNITYVAMTRCRKKLFLLLPSLQLNDSSPFFESKKRKK